MGCQEASPPGITRYRMDNFFGFFDFTRPGRGYVDDSVYPPFIRYWRRYGRNFFRLIQLNLLYAVVTLPVYVWLVSLINVVSTQSGGGILSTLGALCMYVAVDWPDWVPAALFAASTLMLGPASAALSCAALNCAWDRPGLFWPRVWEAFRDNWRQALPIGILDVLVCYITLFYFVDGVTVYGSLGIVLRTCWGCLCCCMAWCGCICTRSW